MIKNKKRGSAMIVVVFMVTAVAVTAFAGLALTGTVAKDQVDDESQKKDQYIVEGAVQLANADLIAGKVTPGTTKQYVVGGKSVSVTIDDNSAAVDGTVKISVKGVSNPKIAKAKIVPIVKGVIDNVWAYGLYSNGSLGFPSNSVVTGSVYVKNSLGALGLNVKVTKDLKTSSSFNPLGLLNILGAIVTGVAVKPMPSVLASNYQSNADTVLVGDQTLVDYQFPQDYSITYINGNLNLTGDIKNNGTFYVTGNVTITGKTKPNSGSDHYLVITPGTITFSGTGLDVEGYFYAGTQATISNTLKLKGGIAANAFGGSSAYNITWDQWLTKSATNGAALHAPAMWP